MELITTCYKYCSCHLFFEYIHHLCAKLVWIMQFQDFLVRDIKVWLEHRDDSSLLIWCIVLSQFDTPCIVLLPSRVCAISNTLHNGFSYVQVFVSVVR